MKQLEHPDVGVMRRRLQWMVDHGFIGGFSWVRWTPDGVRYSFKIKQPIRHLYYINIGDEQPSHTV